MSMAETRAIAFAGIEAVPVRVSARTAPGPPSFTVAGLDGMTGRSTAARVRAAFAGIGLSLPPRRVLVEVSPADAPLQGDHHDLPVALCVLAAMGVLPREELSWYAALGGLAPDGGTGGGPGGAIGGRRRVRGGTGPYLSRPQGGEAAWAGSIEVLAALDLVGLMAHFRGSQC